MSLLSLSRIIIQRPTSLENTQCPILRLHTPEHRQRSRFDLKVSAGAQEASLSFQLQSRDRHEETCSDWHRDRNRVTV